MKTLRNLSAAFTAAFLMTLTAFAADAAGTWTWSQPGAGGQPVTVTLTLEAAEAGEGMYTGTYTETGGEGIPVRGVRVNEETITFSVAGTAHGVARYTGRIDGSTINGTIQIAGRPSAAQPGVGLPGAGESGVTQPSGETREVEWTANKSG